MSAQQQAQEIAHPVVKGVSAVVASFGLATWGDVAALLAAIYTACLIGEWIWKKIILPMQKRK